MSQRKRTWQPKARKCSQCRELKPIKDKRSKTADPQKKLCEKFGWEITNELAAKQAVCRIEKPKRRKK